MRDGPLRRVVKAGVRTVWRLESVATETIHTQGTLGAVRHLQWVWCLLRAADHRGGAACLEVAHAAADVCVVAAQRRTKTMHDDQYAMAGQPWNGAPPTPAR